MTDIEKILTLEEQVEQFKEKHYTFAHDDLPDDTDALLRSFMEECCIAADKSKPDIMDQVVGEPLRIPSKHIRLRFAWLEK